ncbi:27 kDa hemolymph glycoprotein-like [Pollicipes pollicipes]|uniref:27 kDa hemolymph glycoprotein-like n=1 Tax=Pollicipes pollicipes TaxID=41117 RepID=UPI001884F1C7|nr:27 kDa hemolymph glycoprotein-like [Pollicipes pollicipes]
MPDDVRDSLERARDGFYSQCRAQGIADPEHFVTERRDRAAQCVKDNVDVDEIVQDISRHMENGELDVLFSSRCRDLPPRILDCIERPLVELERCLNETERAKNYSATLMAGLREAVDFLCFNDGERIAIFLGEKGQECMSSQQVRDSLTQCLEKHNLTASTAPDVLDSTTRGFTPAFCHRMFVAHDCAADALRLCDDPTPSNVVDSLLRAFEGPLPWPSATRG